MAPQPPAAAVGTGAAAPASVGSARAGVEADAGRHQRHRTAPVREQRVET